MFTKFIHQNARLPTMLLVLLALGSCGGNKPKTRSSTPLKKESILRLELHQVPNETSQTGFLGKEMSTLAEALDAIRNEGNDPKAKAMLLQVGDMEGAWGRAWEIAAAITRFKKAKLRPVHCHFNNTDNLGYWFMAKSCDHIQMTPGGTLNLVGVATQVLYFKDLLDSVGVRADLLQVGNFKGAADPFVQNDMPEEVRQTLSGLLDDMHGQLTEGIAQGRHLEPKQVAAILEKGPFDRKTALEHGLVDDVGFEGAALSRLKKKSSTSRSRVIELQPKTSTPDLWEIISMLSDDQETLGPEGPRVGLVYLDGEITDSEEESLSGGNAGPFIEAVLRMANDKNVRALVLRIDSPGGSALASDRMWHAVRVAAKKKPVVASIGDMAASGGYYVASAADTILVCPSSIVGSIGVVGGKVALHGLLEKVGIHPVSIQRGQQALWSSMVAPFSDSEREILTGIMQRTYIRFLSRIKAVRTFTEEELSQRAQGRIFSGSRAVALRLADQMGDLHAAIALARQRGGLPEDRVDPGELEVWPSPLKGLEKMVKQLSGGASSQSPMLSASRSAFAAQWEQTVEPALGFATRLQHEPFMVQLPFVLSIQ